ncbi:helix-turn-helix transcriptional regulator [Sphingomonas sp.]|uniref:helix-turn-helix transcriptional regulator n=1 Tax=Sphingomonas sp. TaxID=28214 RepID=UPI001ED6A8EB|nr:helix-turn-helix transcriptional regulator [Sphingomonas sp.]MBX3594727.1 helix-turn-helix transcriptional regulator [Sphingomonas sp.]
MSGQETRADAIAALDPALLAALYHGPLEPEPWRGFLQALARHAGCDNAAISLQLSRKGLASVTMWAEPPPIARDDARQVKARHAALGDMDPMSNALKRTGEVLLLDEVASREGLEKDDFYLEVMKPFGIAQAMGMYVAEPGGLECNVGLIAHDDRFRFTPAHKALMLALRDHVRTALELFSRIHRDETEIAALNDTLDRLTIATCILDGRGQVLRANKAARALLARDETFTTDNGRLRVRGRSDQRKFDSALDEALAARIAGREENGVRAFRCTDPENLERGILVRSIPSPPKAPIDRSPAVLVYATGGDSLGSFEQLISALFDLTPSEARLAALLTQGYSLSEASEQAGITEGTARSYSKRVYAKVGVNRQTELVRLILRSVAMLG